MMNVIAHFVHLQVFDVGESRAMPIEFPDEASGFGAWRTFVLSAGLADAVSRTVTAPIDRLKTQLQVSSTIYECFVPNKYPSTVCATYLQQSKLD